MKEQIKPGLFGRSVPVDGRRGEFDCKNEQILHSGNRPDMVFFGDSITQHWELDCWFPAARVVNRGAGMDTTGYGARRFAADVVQLNPKAVVILMGINDLISIAPDLWNRKPGADPEQVIAGIEQNMRSMLSQCDAFPVFLCSILPQSLCQPYDRVLFNNCIVKTNQILRQLCAEYGAEYVDYYSALAQNGELPAAYTYDGVHPNAAGYAVMAKLLKEKVAVL